jgi:hypothetical protein
MYCLEVIKSTNAKATAKVAVNTSHTNREPSRCRSSQGLVVHSATLRSTVFFDFDNPRAEREAEKIEAAFKRYEKTKDLRALNRVVDSYFN